MTNNTIVEWVFYNVDIDKFIHRLISQSKLEQNACDLKQFIYLILLEYDNEKLNKLYNNKVLPQFITQIILNQRNYYRSYYNLYFKPNSKELDINIPQPDDEYDHISDDKLNFINKELRKYVSHRKDLSREQEYEMLAYELYRMYLKRNIGDNKLTIIDLSKRLDLSYRTVLRLMKFAKENIKKNYNK